ncbi:MAG: hypothetical protein LC101_05155 [Flavobacteriales bacterium]|nr:hypothetical protein [Flavobacteriales bacterium]
MTSSISSPAQIRVNKHTQLSGHKQPVYTLCKGIEEDVFYSAGGDKWIAKWHLTQPDSATAIAQAGSTVYSLTLIPLHNILVVGESSGAITMIDLSAGKTMKRISFHKTGIFSLTWHKTAQRLYATSSIGEFSVWDLEKDEPVFYKKLSDKKLRSLDIHASLNRLILGSSDGVIHVLDANSFEILHQFQAHPWGTNVVRIKPDTQTLLTSSRDAHIRSWDMASDFTLQQSVPAHNYAIYQLVFSPDKKLFATCSRDKTIKIWNPETIHPYTRINYAYSQSHNRSVNNLLWHDYNNLLISCGDDNQIMIWDIQYE